MRIKIEHTLMLIFACLLMIPVLLISKTHACHEDEEEHGELTDEKFDIIRLLADEENWSRRNIIRNVTYDHNDYGCNENLHVWHNGGWVRAYPRGGGHPGWDVVFTQDDNHPFYSITRGTLVALGLGSSNTIAIYDAVNEKMVLYLHADRVNTRLDVGQWIDFKTYLGEQGEEGLATAEHIHIEVRELTARQKNLPFFEQMEILTRVSRGRFDGDRPTIPPIPYLHHFAEWYLEEELEANACLVWAKFRERD